jgi:hypothetical protein
MSDELLQSNNTIIIANGESLSGSVGLGGSTMVGIVMPATWTAANLTVQASHDGATYNNLYDDLGTEVTVTAAASRYIALDPSVFAGIRYLKVRSGTSGSAVNQGGDRTITLVTRPV